MERAKAFLYYDSLQQNIILDNYMLIFVLSLVRVYILIVWIRGHLHALNTLGYFKDNNNDTSS